ncbi:BatD family protein [Nibrella saemangeumensis]|uniref:BatD family protein n=1 Tax=Nibrella saemangeumensis TaxID=1084526 RepID=A0ABP8NNL5_9BACT
MVSIELSETDFSIDRPFTIAVIIKDSEQRPVIAFPTIPGFTKRETSTSVTSEETGGNTVISRVISQNYIATKPGTYRLPPFTVTVNKAVARSEGATLTVRSVADTDEDAVAATTPVVSKDAAYFSLITTTNSVYVGEGFPVRLSLFVAEDYPYELRFDRLEQQLQSMLKEIRPFDVWEENLGLTEVKRIPITIKGRKYTEFRIYEAIYFPLTARALRMAEVSLTMLANKTGNTRQKPEAVTFTSQSVTIEVKRLPSHPLRGQVAVGSFRLQEGLERRGIKVGQSVRYDFRVTGEGNISALQAPRVTPSEVMEVFPPKTQESKKRTADGIAGYKTFKYFLVPKQNGRIPLEKTFQWVYFDPKKERYDTLLPRMVLRVGETAIAADTVHSDLPGSIYTGIEQLDSSEQAVNWPVLVRAIANVLIALMILGMIFLLFRK